MIDRKMTASRQGDEAGLTEEVARLRRELRRSRAALAEKETELKTYLSTLSHEIKTPIVSMRGFCALLMEQFGEQIPEDGKHYLERIGRNIDRLETLVRDLVLLSGFQRDDIHFETVDVTELIDDILVEHYHENSAQTSSFSVQPDLPLVHGYREGLRHVFSNLIGNAIKYRREDVPLKVEIGCLDDELFLKFYVRDNGVGIPAAVRNKVFNMFVRAGNKKGVTGSGLGLSIVRQIITAHGGEIWVDSRQGRGSTFYFTRPIVSNAMRVIR